ncbi:unnamed protein product [Meganyctiphanes norvegica]|uniref:Protein RFT1 homolog n=1 Tax=Meganyctiphanes norvegica TaxID=48144 RepID=A0AAV2RRG5_MEGNR
MEGDAQKLKSNMLLSAAYDTILQICLRILSFVLNAFIVRHVSREVFAVMTVRLHLLYATGLLLSREAFRRAALSSKGFKEIHKLINLVWISSIVAFPITIACYYIWLNVMDPPQENITQHYRSGVFSMIICVLIEVATEVPFILGEIQLWSKTKVIVEGIMQVSRTVLFAFSVYMWPHQSVLMYGISYILGSLLYLILYYGIFAYKLSNKEESKKLPIHSLYQLFPRITAGKYFPEIDTELGLLAWSFFKQGWLKEVLTEGEWYLMSFFTLISLAQQGTYQVVNNLGSLAARLVFRSVEAAAYKYFAQMIYRGKSLADQDAEKVNQVAQSLSKLLRGLILISLVIITFGWSYSNLLLRIYGGETLSEGIGTPLMRTQCIFIVFLAINGITEAYTFAVMDDAQLGFYNRLLIAFTILYVSSAVILSNYFGAIGFVIANSLNMSLRIVYSFWYIHMHYKNAKNHPLSSFQIPGKLLRMFIIVFIFTQLSEQFVYPKSIILHVLIGVLCLIIVMYAVRWDLQVIYEKILKFISSILSKIVKTNEENGSEKFSNVWLVDSLHHFLYR